MRLFAPRQLAYIKLGGRRHYLGPWGSAAADAGYRAAVRELLGVVHLGPIVARTSRPVCIDVTHVSHLADAFAAHARTYYVKRGRQTHSALNVSRVRDLLFRSSFDQTTLEGADACWLRDFRSWLAEHLGGSINRDTLNEYVSIVVRMFRFGVANGLCEPDAWPRLKALEPVKKNRPPSPQLKPLRESVTRKPVPREWIRRVRPHMSRTLRLMMGVQLLTGMRPEELCAIRAEDLAPTKHASVFIYEVHPEWTKTDHEESAGPRRVWLGPRTMKLLRLTGHRTGCFFRPADALEDRATAAAAGRKTPLYPSHDVHVRRSRRRGRGIIPNLLGETYTPDSYRLAMTRACERAIAAQLRAAGGTPIPARDRMGVFTPYRLRHNCATEIANREQIQVAQVMLGHKNIQTTAGYVKPWEKHAVAAALKYG
jgi:integrase